jgi:hypothetical protein
MAWSGRGSSLGDALRSATGERDADEDGCRTILVLVATVGCSPSPASRPLPTSEPTPASEPPIDYVALEAEIEKAITTGPATLDDVRVVLVSVDGETKIAHYRHGFTEDDHGHVSR